MELLKLVGIGMVLASTLWVGLHAALRLRRTHEQLNALCAALHFAETEIQFAAPGFASLCARVEQNSVGAVREFFRALSAQAEQADLAAEGRTRRAAKEAGLCLPDQVMKVLERLFDHFGSCDREGQTRQIRLAAAELTCLNEELRQSMDGRCKSYETLGFAAGAAILILVL